tara:strand:+ start:27655 stop:28494 length:840 start_codon:yes stop_codon:yes gene_type:complete
MSHFQDVSQAVGVIQATMRDAGQLVHTERWQSWDIKDRPEAQMVEVLHQSFSCPIPGLEPKEMASRIGANMPWAEDHFQERVCGFPLNPGKEWRNWPWGGHADKHRDGELFNHNYMERYWPKCAGYTMQPTEDPEDFINKNPATVPIRNGIRARYGDLQDVIDLLADEPLTRQAYLPVWFPEDTGAQNTGRKPCTLGYHFIMRNGKLDIVYYIRSCDLFRHFHDDVFLTMRLAQWVLDQCFMKNHEVWGKVKLGNMHMHITSLHMFINDYVVMFKRRPR